MHKNRAEHTAPLKIVQQEPYASEWPAILECASARTASILTGHGIVSDSTIPVAADQDRTLLYAPVAAYTKTNKAPK